MIPPHDNPTDSEHPDDDLFADSFDIEDEHSPDHDGLNTHPEPLHRAESAQGPFAPFEKIWHEKKKLILVIAGLIVFLLLLKMFAPKTEHKSEAIPPITPIDQLPSAALPSASESDSLSDLSNLPLTPPEPAAGPTAADPAPVAPPPEPATPSSDSSALNADPAPASAAPLPQNMADRLQEQSQQLQFLEQSLRQVNIQMAQITQALDSQYQLLENFQATLENNNQNLVAQLRPKASEAPKEKKSPAVSEALLSAPRLSVLAIIPGRAWLKTPEGRTLTVTEGDMLEPYGKVLVIDPKAGTVITSSGVALR